MCVLLKTKHKSRQAFTLVELIVVLVVLAIIAAITIPALTGYIKKTKKEKQTETVHYALVASQAVMTEVYGLGSAADSATLSSDGNNVNWRTGTNKKWGDKVLGLMDRGRGQAGNEPYIFVFAVGTSDPAAGLTLTQQYTVYYVAYVENENSPAIFYINGEWFYTYPRIDKNSPIWDYTIGGKTFRNTLMSEHIPLQFYIVSNRTGLSDTAFWRDSSPKSLQSHSEPNFKG